MTNVLFNEQGVAMGLRDYMTVDEIADRLGIHPESVRRLLRQRQIRGVKLGNNWLVPRHQLETYAVTYHNMPGRRPKNPAPTE